MIKLRWRNKIYQQLLVETGFARVTFMEITESKLKIILREQRKEYENYIGTLAEDFNSNLKLVAESTSGIQKQLVFIKEMVARNTEDLEIMKMDIEFIKHSLKKKVDIEEFATLEKRVLKLEKAVSRN